MHNAWLKTILKRENSLKILEKNNIKATVLIYSTAVPKVMVTHYTVGEICANTANFALHSCTSLAQKSYETNTASLSLEIRNQY